MPPYNRLKGLYTKNFSLGLGYIGAILEKQGYAVKIYCCDNNKPGEVERFDNYSNIGDWQADVLRHQRFVNLFENIRNFDYVWNEVREVIKECSPDVIGITSSTANYLSALVIAEMAKDFNKSIYTVFGGAHPTVLPDEVLSEKNADFVVRGEGEFTFLELLDALYGAKKIEDVRGLSFKFNNKVIHNPQRESIKDLDSLPFPARHLQINKVDYSKSYLSALFKDVLISRGCPYQCKFCAANSVWGKHWRDRSVENVVQEVKMLMDEYGAKHFEILSDTLGVNEKWMVNFCESMRPLNITWSCTTRIDKVNEKILKFMKESGCIHTHLGIESGNDRILEAMNKRISVSQVRKTTDMLNKIGIPWATFFMVGFPEESLGEIKDTFRLIKDLKPKSHKIAVLVPYPGTEYYDYLKKMGRLPEKINWNWFDGRSSYLSFTSNIPEDEFIKIRNMIFNYVDHYNSKKQKMDGLKAIVKKNTKLIFTHPLLFLRKIKRFVRVGFSLKKYNTNL